MPQPEFRTCFCQHVVERDEIIRLHPNLVATLAGKGNPANHGIQHTEIHFPEGHERHCLGGNVLMSKFRHQVSRFRSGNGEANKFLTTAPNGDASLRQMIPEPSQVIHFSNAGAEDHETVIRQLGDGEIANDLALAIEHRSQHHAARARHFVRHQLRQPGFGTLSCYLVFGEAGDLDHTDTGAHGLAFLSHRIESIGATECHILHRLHTVGRKPEGVLQPIGGTEHGILRRKPVIDCRLSQRTTRWQFLIREGDRETAGIVFLHLLIGVALGRVRAEARAVHGKDIHVRLTLDHPLGERETDAAALAEPCHHTASQIHIPQPRHRADQRVAVRRKGEGTVYHRLHPRFCQERKMLIGDIKGRRDPIKVRLQKLMPKIPRRLMRRPGHTGFFVGSEQKALALLTRIEFGLKIDQMRQFDVKCLDFVQGLSDEIMMLHCQHWQFQPNHTANFAGPETACIHHFLTTDRALVSDHRPAAVLLRDQLLDLGVAIDLGAALAGGDGVGIGHARRIDMTLVRIVDGTNEMARIDQRMQALRLVHRDEVDIKAHISALGDHCLQIIEALGCASGHHPAREMHPGRLAGNLLDLLIEVDGVFLQLGHIRIAVQRMHAARRMPGRTRCQLAALHQNHVFPAQFDEVIENATANDAPANDNDLRMRFHRYLSRYCQAPCRHPAILTQAPVHQPCQYVSRRAAT